MDLSKLTPAPWNASDAYRSNGWTLVEIIGATKHEHGHVALVGRSFWWDIPNKPCHVYEDEEPIKVDAEFIALARNAFDVMLRRGWGTRTTAHGRWFIDHHLHNQGEEFHSIIDGLFDNLAECWDALVAADKWLSQREANRLATGPKS